MSDTTQKSPWPEPAGLIPVTSGRAEDANIHNRAFLDSILVEMRVIDAVEPDLTTEIFGERFASPIMTPAFSHLNKVGKDDRKPMIEYAHAAKELNRMNWVGMEPNDAYGEIAATGARSVRIIKPFADHDEILKQMAYAAEHKAIAVGVDIDHVPGGNGRYDVVDGIPMGAVTQADLKEYAAATKLPFIAKGVLSVRDAVKAAEAGCRGIVVSHHHGRIPFGIPPVSVLPAIKDALAQSGVTIFVDCSMDTGYDAYKALALGADAISVGRGILAPLLKEGREGVKEKMIKMDEQLREMMMYTNVADMGSFDPTVLHW